MHRVNAVLGALAVLLAYQFAERTTTPGIALVVALVLAFDPFALRNDSRMMLETPTTAALLTGWLVLLGARDTAPTTRRAVLAGLLLGCAIVTKDIALVFVLVPLVLATLWRRTLQWYTALLVSGAALLPYTAYLVVLLSTGHFGDFLSAKSLGVRRMIGLVQITGFNAPEAPSLGSRLVDQVAHFGTSYALIALCLFAGIGAALSPRPARRMIGLIALTSGIFGAYAATIGTLEEQFGYYVLIPSALALAVLVAENSERLIVWPRLILGVATVFTALTVFLGVTARLGTDDAYHQAYTWLNDNVPPGTPVGLTNVTTEFAYLPHQSYGVWPSLQSLTNHHARYVVTQSRTLAQGYGYAHPELLTWLQHNAEPAFTADGPSGEHTTVWRLDEQALRHAVDSGISPTARQRTP